MSYIPEQPNIYQGKQAIINSDRILFNAKDDSILLFSNKAIGFSANGSFHFDTGNNEENKFVVNAPNIYLGLQDNGNYPIDSALLGDKTEEWLIELLDMIDGFVRDVKYKVAYTAGKEGKTKPHPDNESMLALRVKQIKKLKTNIKDIKSKRIKIV